MMENDRAESPDAGGDVRDQLADSITAEVMRRHSEIILEGGLEKRKPMMIAAADYVRAALAKPDASNASAEALKPFLWNAIETRVYEACNGTVWKTAQEATEESYRARAALAAGGDEATKSEGGPLEDNRWITEAKATLERLSAFLQKTGAPHRVDWQEWIDSADKHLGLKWLSERPSDPTAAPAVDVEAVARIIEDKIEVDIDFELADFKVNGKPAATAILSLLNASDAERAR